MNEKQQQVLEILARVVEQPAGELAPEQSLKTDLQLDSYKALDLLATIEEEFDVEISEVEAAKVETVGDVLALADK